MEIKYIFLSMIFIVSFGLSVLFLFHFIKYSQRRSLFDQPDERKTHSQPTPSSGGLIFGVLTILLLPYLIPNSPYTFVLAAALMLLIIGFLDDRYDLSAKMKFIFQIIAGIFALWEIGPLNIFENNPLFINEIVTFFFIIGFTNAFNLIDGIDGLAGIYATFILTIIITLFILGKNYPAAIFTTTICAGTLAFLKFNLNPAKIFLGDTGSLFLGFLISIFSIVIINSDMTSLGFVLTETQLQLLFLGLLSLPMIDTLRVMIGRIIKGTSPFKADRTHLHHLLRKIGLKTSEIPLFFLLMTIIYTIETSLMMQLNFAILSILLTIAATTVFMFNTILYLRIKQHKKRMKKSQNSLDYILKTNHLIQRKSLHTSQKKQQ